MCRAAGSEDTCVPASLEGVPSSRGAQWSPPVEAVCLWGYRTLWAFLEKTQQLFSIKCLKDQISLNAGLSVQDEQSIVAYLCLKISRLFPLAVMHMIWVNYEMRNGFQSIRWNSPLLKFINVFRGRGRKEFTA